MRAVIDTNVLVYDIVEDSLFHRDAERILDLIDVWIIPSIVIYELIWFFKEANVETVVIKEIIEDVISNAKTKILTDDKGKYTKKALELINKHKKKIARFNDFVILSASLTNKIPLATFDKKLRAEAKKMNLVLLPDRL